MDILSTGLREDGAHIGSVFIASISQPLPAKWIS